MSTEEQTPVNISEAIAFAFKGLGENAPHHVNEIADYILSANYAPCAGMEAAVVRTKVQNYLARNIKAKNKEARKYAKKLNPKTRKPMKGMYEIARPNRKGKVVITPAPQATQQTLPGLGSEIDNPAKTNTLYLGKAGELAVLSELIFRGYNASLMNVDEGIDITASKASDFYFIQVKTTLFKEGRIQLSIRNNNFVNANLNAKIFYIIVFRYLNRESYQNRFIIFSKSDIEKFIFNQTVSNSNGNVTIKIKYEDKSLYLYNGSNIEKIDYHLDNFDYIK